MAFSASALSFMLENLGKTVILTGSQVYIHLSFLIHIFFLINNIYIYIYI